MKTGDFPFTLFSKRKTDEPNEEPEMNAELKDIGDKERVDITHSNPLLIFSLHELIRYVKLDRFIREKIETIV